MTQHSPRSLRSPAGGEEEVNWQRRMNRVAATSTKRTSHVRGTVGSASPTPQGSGLMRSHSFSAATIAAAAAALTDSPAPTGSGGAAAALLSSPHLTKHASAAGGGRRGRTVHHRSMSNVVDWTPYNKRKNKPVAVVAPFTPHKPPQHSRQPSATLLPSFNLPSTRAAAVVHSFPSTAAATTPRIASPPPHTAWHRYLRLLHVLRHSEVARVLRGWMQTTTYFTLCAVMCIFSLYAQDFNIAFFPPTADTAIDALLTIIFVFFAVDLLLHALLRGGYALSFFFFLDLIGTLSLILDISYMLPLDTQSLHDGSAGQHATQSGNVIRITRVARIFRIMQIMRVVKLLKFGGEVDARKSHAATHTASGVNTSDRHTANKVGLQLSELIDKRVILMLLGLLIILPFFTVDTTNYGISEQMGLSMLDAVLASPAAANSSDALSYIASYENYHSNLIYLYVAPAALTLVDLRADYDGQLRASDYDAYTTASGSTAVFNIRAQYFQSALYTIILTTIIVVMFVLGSVLISKDVYFLVVAPLERMTSIIKKLAGTICFLTNSDHTEPVSRSGAGSDKGSRASSDGEGSSDEGGDGARTRDGMPANETRVIEGIIEKLGAIFQVEPDATMAGPKALQRMAGSKHTEITTNTSVVSIQVVERPRVEVEDVGMEEGKAGEEVDVSRYRELRSVEDGIANAGVLSHFRLYLTANLLMENLLFYQEVERYRAILQSHSHSLYANFISSASSTQVNISAALHDTIKQRVLCPSAAIFDEAQAECVMLMKAHVRGFCESKYAQLYMHKKGAGLGMGEVMYKKKRGAAGGAAAAAAKAELSATANASDSARSKRNSLQAHLENKLEEVDEEAEAETPPPHRRAPLVVQPPIVQQTAALNISQQRRANGRKSQLSVAALSVRELEDEMAALERPGGESDALVRPGATSARKGDAKQPKKESEAAKPPSPAPTAAVPTTADSDGTAPKRQSVATSAEVVRIASQATADADLPQHDAGELDEAAVGSGVAAEAVASSEAKVDSDVEEEVARLLDQPSAPAGV